MVQETRHEHEPVVVVDDARTDRYGEATSWLYHVECLVCGVDLPDAQIEVGACQLVRR
jgi:hypothetical protein